MDTNLDFLKKGIEKGTGEGTHETEKAVEHVNKYRDAVKVLFDTIDDWLSRHKKNTPLKSERSTLQISEMYVGTYDTEQMEIKMGGKLIRIIPKGTDVIGYNGRIDVLGKKEDVLFSEKGDVMLVTDDFTAWRIVVMDPTACRCAADQVDEEAFMKLIDCVS